MGWGGGSHDAWLCCCLQLAAPIGLSPPALSLNPLPPCRGAHWPLTPLCSLPCLAYPYRPTHPPFPSGCANGAPGTVPVSPLRVGPARRRATSLAIGEGGGGGLAGSRREILGFAQQVSTPSHRVVSGRGPSPKLGTNRANGTDGPNRTPGTEGEQGP